MRRLEEYCNICGKSIARFHAYKSICHHCNEVVCRQCLVSVNNSKNHWKICRKCEGVFS